MNVKWLESGKWEKYIVLGYWQEWSAFDDGFDSPALFRDADSNFGISAHA